MESDDAINESMDADDGTPAPANDSSNARRWHSIGKSLLAIDIGNTKIHIGLFEDKELVSSFSLSSRRLLTSDEFSLMLESLLNRFDRNIQSIEEVVAGSVVPSLNVIIKEAFASYGKKAYFMGEDFPAPIRILYKNPEEVGMDRLANAIACRELYGCPAIIVDFGTAITFDVLSGKGEYLGGIIAPGVEISLQGLFTATARLPKVDIDVPKEVIGKSTKEAIRSGVVFGTVELVEGLIERIKEEMGETIIVLTGGMGEFFAKQVCFSCVVDKFLTLEGLCLAWEKSS
ncbi:type III pantothenate kinase [bacterium]|nr:type III pantothenate kinase [bacterium]